MSKLSKTFVLLFLVLSQLGCSNSKSSSDVKSNSEQIGSILIDFMQNGKEITDSDQRKIDLYLSTFGQRVTSYKINEQVMINAVLKMYSQFDKYKSATQQSDKLNAMDKFNTEVSDYQTILKQS